VHTVSISHLVDELCHEFDRTPTLASVQNVMARHPVDPASLERFADFRPNKYTRNLAYRCAKFEVLILCWDVGQTSRIHNHWDQQCWMAAPVGRLQVVNYRVVEGTGGAGHCKLARADDFWMTPGNPGYVDPAKPIHTVGNPIETGVPAMSIHVYSLPYDRCVIYSLGDHQAVEVELKYDNTQGLPDDDH